ncbi:hypothetical protein MNBD_GAMMA09-2504 [hydrothermal vent metagenome]|uniref:Uncharacterized protein n=1 Tax=hydrothermal vent metagenome TaxID=652676 RepID=A0A3B0XMM2_9ZZZZ
MKSFLVFSGVVSALFVSSILSASEVEIISVNAECDKARECIFRVELRHADTGWDHYANFWQVMGPDGKVLVERVLHHPHVNEQPFTRSSSRVTIAANIKQVTIKAGDKPNGLNSKVYKLTLR